jgi:hypothetical protein
MAYYGNFQVSPVEDLFPSDRVTRTAALWSASHGEVFSFGLSLRMMS